MSKFKSLDTLYDGMSEERKAKIQAKTNEMKATIELAKLRKSMQVTQAEMAKRIDTSQANISKLESSDNVQLATLINYTNALGVKLSMQATMPDGKQVDLIS